MEALKDILENHMKNMKVTKFYRFQVFVQGAEKKKTVGMAYLKEGQSIYTLRLWMFVNDKYFLLPSKEDPAKYLLMTREPNKSNSSKNKYFWNIVGNAKVDSAKGVMEMDFDLLDKKVFMSIYPEESATPYGQPIPEAVLDAA